LFKREFPWVGSQRLNANVFCPSLSVLIDPPHDGVLAPHAMIASKSRSLTESRSSCVKPERNKLLA